jgi:tyrosinase
VNGVRTRRDVWSLEEEQPWHPIVRAYALAVGELQTKSPDSPGSWAYQAAIHGMEGFVQPDRFRGQCQHATWFFLPWHRLYLHWFERLLQVTIAGLSDVPPEVRDSWALPYWNYGAGGQRASLPGPFREQRLPDSADQNPLFVEERNQYVNDGEPMNDLVTRADAALAQPTFSERAPSGGFGGAQTGFNHRAEDPSRWPGLLEQTPHGDVHMEVGGSMAMFHTAGLDPVFWMHHANIDRLWEVWLGQGDRTNPDPSSPWGTREFQFHDPDGEPVVGSADQTLDTSGSLGYTYEDVSTPEPRRRRRRRVLPTPETPAELVGATGDSVELTGGRADVEFDLGGPTGPAARRGARPPERAFLTIEGVEGESDPGVSYAVYVNLPSGDEPGGADDTHYVGNLSFFGIERVGNVDDDPAGHSLRFSYDITDVIEDLDERDEWDRGAVTVTFSPLSRGRADRGDRQGAGPPVSVGRIGVYYQ